MRLHLHDQPMALGDHLEELRGRLFKVVAIMGAALILGMVFQVELKTLVEQPLRQAIRMADAAAVTKIGIPTDPQAAIFRLDHLAESAINAVKVSFYFALAIAFPMLVYQIWGFVTPGLKRSERAAGFLFVPAAVIFFYAGVLFGYFLGLPFLYKLLIEWTANENAILELRQTYYIGFFFTMTLCFGLVMDIPWLVMVLVRVRLVTPAQVAAKRKYVVLISAIVAAIATPPDPVSQMAMLGLILVLFEAGLAASRVLYSKAELVTDEQADSLPPDEEAGAANDGRPPWAVAADDIPPPTGHPPSEDEIEDEDGPVARPSAWDRAGEARQRDDDEQEGR